MRRTLISFKAFEKGRTSKSRRALRSRTHVSSRRRSERWRSVPTWLSLPDSPGAAERTPCDASGQFDVLGHFVWLVWKHSPGFHHVSLHKVTYQAQEPSQSRSCGNWWRLTWCYFQGDAVRHCPVDYCWYELPQTWTKKTARRHQKKATSRYIQIYHDISRCSSFYREV